MSIIRPQPPVYWIEADEEASLVSPAAEATIGRRSLLAYLLLQRLVIAHPADFWRSRHTNSLVLNSQAQPLLKGAMQIDLGDSATIREYMTDRIERLRRDKASSQTNVELQQYERYALSLGDQSNELDEVFTRSGATFAAQKSRDKKFRKLIRNDLQNEMPWGVHLARSIRQGMRRLEADRLVNTLVDLTHDRRRFVSIDGIMSRLMDAGCPRSVLERIHRRLQVLHWEARGEGQIELPILSRAIANKLDSSDPDVFWAAVDRLVGRGFQRALMVLPWQTALFIVHQLRNDSVWASFVETYHVIVETVERDHAEIAEALVIHEVRAKYPEVFDILWSTRPDKMTILSWVCHAGSLVSWYPQRMELCLQAGQRGSSG